MKSGAGERRHMHGVAWSIRLAAIAAVISFCGCASPIVKERSVTAITGAADTAPGSRALIGREAVQQYERHFSRGLDRWKIRRKEVLFYQAQGTASGIREEREIAVRAESDASKFLPLLIRDYFRSQEREKKQDEVFHYVMGMLDDARMAAERREPAGWPGVENLLDAYQAAARLNDTLDVEAETLLRSGRDAELAAMLARLPYRVERAAEPSVPYAVRASFTIAEPAGAGAYSQTTVTLFFDGTFPLVPPETQFEVQVYRSFSDSGSGKQLAAVKETVLLRPESAIRNGVQFELLR